MRSGSGDGGEADAGDGAGKVRENGSGFGTAHGGVGGVGRRSSDRCLDGKAHHVRSPPASPSKRSGAARYGVSVGGDDDKAEEGSHGAGGGGLPLGKLTSLEDKLKNRPSMEVLFQQNILKINSTAVTPHIHATQQRLLMRQVGSSLEKKLRSRPHMRQLVMHNIIPEEDEYKEHENRLWGHIQVVASDSASSSKPPTTQSSFAKQQQQQQQQQQQARAKPPHRQAGEGVEALVDRLQDAMLERLATIRQGIDSLRLARTRITSREPGHWAGFEEDEERLEHHVRAQIRAAETIAIEHTSLLRQEILLHVQSLPSSTVTGGGVGSGGAGVLGGSNGVGAGPGGGRVVGGRSAGAGQHNEESAPSSHPAPTFGPPPAPPKPPSGVISSYRLASAAASSASAAAAAAAAAAEEKKGDGAARTEGAGRRPWGVSGTVKDGRERGGGGERGSGGGGRHRGGGGAGPKCAVSGR